MEKILEKIASFVCRSHRAILIFICLLTALSIALVARLELKSDLMDALPSNSPAVDEFTGFLSDFGSADNLILAIKSRDKRAAEHIDLIETLGKKLAASPYVDYADYNIVGGGNEAATRGFPLFLDAKGRDELKKRLTPGGIRAVVRENKKELLSPLGSPAASELIQKDPLNMRSIVVSSFTRSKGQGNPAAFGYYISKDGSLALIFVKPAGKGRDLKFVRGFSLWLDQTVREALREHGAGADVEVGLAGPFAFAMEANARMLPEVVKNALVSCLLVLLIFRFIFKKGLLVVALAGATLLFALTLTLAAAYAIFGSLNMVSSIVTAMLMGLGIDYVIHIYTRLEAESKARGLEEGLKTAFSKTAPGVVVGALTTSAAFFCITVTSFKGLHSLGIIAGIGVIACLASTLLFMPSAILLLESFKKGLVLAGRTRDLKWGFPASAVKNRPGAVFAVSAVILAVSAAGFTGIRFNNDPESIGLKKSPAAETDNEISKGFSQRRNPLLVTVSASGPDTLMERMDALSERIDRLQRDGVIGGASTINAFIPGLKAQRQALHDLRPVRSGADWALLKRVFKDALEENGFVYGRDYDAYLDGLRSALGVERVLRLEDLDGVGGNRLKYFYNRERSRLAAYLFPKETEKGAGWAPGDLSRVSAAVTGLGEGFSVTGASVLFSVLKTSIIRDSIVASAISSVLMFFILFAQFKTIGRVVLTLVPLAAGLAVTFGVMGLAGINFNFINIGAVPLLLGIGVDYGVYVMQDHLENRGPAQDAVSHVGLAVVLCALTTIAGFGSLATFAFKGISSLGVVISIGVTACLLSALLLLPAILRLIEDRRTPAHEK